MNRHLPSRLRARVSLICLALALTPACAKLPRRARLADAETLRPAQGATGATAPRELININRATREELARLPGVGEGIAARIVEHRERFGAFRRAEHLLSVRGISERRYEQLRALVTVE